MRVILPLQKSIQKSHPAFADLAWSVVSERDGRIVGIVGKGIVGAIWLTPMPAEPERASTFVTFFPARDAASATVALNDKMLIVRASQQVLVSCSPGPCAIIIESNVSNVQKSSCDGCGCLWATCEAYGMNRKCCPDCRHAPNE